MLCIDLNRVDRLENEQQRGGTMKLLIALSLLSFSPAFAYDTADFEAEQFVGDSEAALLEKEEAKKRLEQAKIERAEEKAKAKSTAMEAKTLEKQALKVTLSVEKQIQALNEQTDLYRKETARNEANKKAAQLKIQQAKAKLEVAKKKRDQVLQNLKSQKAAK